MKKQTEQAEREAARRRSYGKWCRLMRQARGWTQEGLARRADVSLSTVVKCERGRNYPQPLQRAAIEAAFGAAPEAR